MGRRESEGRDQARADVQLPRRGLPPHDTRRVGAQENVGRAAGHPPEGEREARGTPHTRHLRRSVDDGGGLPDRRETGDPPAPSAPEPAPQIETLPPEPSTPPAPQAADPAAEGFAPPGHAQGCVKVAVAPQLFPTPPELAVRMVALAGIEAGDRVIEPSAGTGTWRGRSAAPSRTPTSISSRSIRSCAPSSRRPASSLVP